MRLAVESAGSVSISSSLLPSCTLISRIIFFTRCAKKREVGKVFYLFVQNVLHGKKKVDTRRYLVCLPASLLVCLITCLYTMNETKKACDITCPGCILITHNACFYVRVAERKKSLTSCFIRLYRTDRKYHILYSRGLVSISSTLSPS